MIKHLVINLTEVVKGLYTDNYKTLKEIEDTKISCVYGSDQLILL